MHVPERKQILKLTLQIWRHFFLLFALTALSLITARGLVEVISEATCYQYDFHHPDSPIQPTSIATTSLGSTMDSFSLAKLEFAISGIIQMLLVMSGIETNPGPSDTGCCEASQQYNRVKGLIEDAQKNFRSKVQPDTLTKPVIEIHEAGGWIFK